MLKILPKLRSLTGRVAGFTMIELLIVITILGILAVAVLSAINPLEQINRGRDTASQSDSEQLLNALERYNAFQERFPWEVQGTAAEVGDGAGTGVPADDSWLAQINQGGTWTTDSECSVLDLLGPGNNDVAGCSGTNEVKGSYVNKLEGLLDERILRAYKHDDTTTSNLYICFLPQSDAFRQKAVDRCGLGSDALPGDFPFDMACPAEDADKMTCLP